MFSVLVESVVVIPHLPFLLRCCFYLLLLIWAVEKHLNSLINCLVVAFWWQPILVVSQFPHIGVCKQIQNACLTLIVLVEASKDVLAREMQDLVLTTGWKRGSCAIPIPEMVTEGNGWGGGHEQS